MANRLSKKDCGKKITLDEVRKVQLNMLDDLVSYLNQHNLRYYLSGGTLLGAIRHHGYIPWDDDIDINMPRPDVEKFFKLTKGRFNHYILSRGCGSDPYSPGCMWFRLYNPEYIIKNNYGGAVKKPFYNPVFIDIFPIDGYPESDSETIRYCHKLIFLGKMLGISWYKGIMGKSRLTRFIHTIAYLPSKAVGYKTWCKIFQKEARKYDFDTSEYVGVTTTVQYLPRERVKKSDYISSVKVQFEGNYYCAPGNYDTYLTNLYHDYMKMPPKEKQVSDHKFVVYRRKK